MNEKQYQQATEQEEKKRKESNIIRCSCGHENEQDALFCENCGSSFDQSPRECPVCGELNSGVYCVFCGANIEGVMCEKCNTLQHSEFCSQCGEPLSDIAIELVRSSTESITVTEMSENEAFSIMKDLHDSLTPQMQKEQEKKRQRIILLSERKYFNDREVRIEGYYSSDNYKVINIDPEEMQEIKATIERLRRFTRAENKRTDAVIKEREDRARAEAQAKAEAQRLQKERDLDRISGVWILTKKNISCVMKIQCNGLSICGTAHFKEFDAERIDEMIGQLDNDKILLQTKSMKVISVSDGWTHKPVKFLGSLSFFGNKIIGYHQRGYHRWKWIFVKQ